MIYSIPHKIEAWEAVAATIAFRGSVFNSQAGTLTPLVEGLFREVDGNNAFPRLPLIELVPDIESTAIDFSTPYRQAEQTVLSYYQLLAQTNGITERHWDYPPTPNFSNIQTTQEQGIIVCPYPLKQELNLPIQVWKAIVKHLRSYGHPVWLMGQDETERMDACGFTENDILSYLPVRERLQRLANARVIVGVPNWATWAAMAWDRKIITLYPDAVPSQRWWWSPTRNTGWRIVYEHHRLEIPVILTGVRTWMKEL